MRVLVLGIGNILLQDEGVGVHVVNRLAARCALPEGVEVIDGGTAGMDLLDRVCGADALIIVDCARLDAVPGTVREIVGEGVPVFFQSRVSPHQIGLSDLLGAVLLLGEMPSRMALIAIEPEAMELGLEMTATGQEAAERAYAVLTRRLAAWGVAARPLPQAAA
ncbi:MAG: HyaD/HybD family hydrogenase maturation endopeptidase [Burkholderiaceae bacterium]|nr:HyaD/HybD family hydrogenase maturation endopeptidase [Burkholderiaceae bacterium]